MKESLYYYPMELHWQTLNGAGVAFYECHVMKLVVYCPFSPNEFGNWITGDSKPFPMGIDWNNAPKGAFPLYFSLN